MALNIERGASPTLDENKTEVIQRDLEALEAWKKQTFELEQTEPHAVLYLQATREALKKKK